MDETGANPGSEAVNGASATPGAANASVAPSTSDAPSAQASSESSAPSAKPSPLDFGHAMHTSPADLPPAQRALEATVVEVLRTVYDPEIPINIYDLGLIYHIDVDAENNVKVKMTLTAPACPVAGTLPGEVERKIESIPQVKSGEVELVWEPAWDKSRMSEAAVLDLGLF